MAILDIFKKKKKQKPASPKPRAGKEKPKEKVEEKISEKPSVSTYPRPRRKETGVAPLVLKSAQVTEKATDLMGKNQYVFKVYPDFSKQEIKKAVEEAYGVDVLKVRTIKVRRKQRRLGRSLGWRKGYQKAVVTLPRTQKIEIMPK